MNFFLQISFLNSIDKNNIPVTGLYLLIFIGVVFAIIKLSNGNYLRQLFSIVSFDKNKFETHTSTYSFSKSSFFLQISYIILITLGISILTNEIIGDFNIVKNFIGVLVFYIIQAVGFVIISSLISSNETSFIKHRIAYYELVSILLFPIILFSYYSPFNLSILVLVVLIASSFLIMLRVSIYLTRLISVFHIILYLCTLEIIPILFLLKFIFS
ncbi:DUF4271 domain-containing protein [bacterium]|nr:DUF4271 domain-containing protein [bacterium]